MGIFTFYFLLFTWLISICVKWSFKKKRVWSEYNWVLMNEDPCIDAALHWNTIFSSSFSLKLHIITLCSGERSTKKVIKLRKLQNWKKCDVHYSGFTVLWVIIRCTVYACSLLSVVFPSPSNTYYRLMSYFSCRIFLKLIS